MSSGATKVFSAKGGATNDSKLNSSSAAKGGNASNKPEKTNLMPKMQPTAEKIQIARIMDTHRTEDEDLQKKIRQVMEIARTTKDQASMAVRSREYDIEQAITLLTESGQTLDREWSQVGKKRKQKSAAKYGIGKDSERAGGDYRKKGGSGDGQTGSRRGGRCVPRRGGRDGDRGGRTDSGKKNEEPDGSRGDFGRSTNDLGIRSGQGGTTGRGQGATGGGGMFSSRTRGRDNYNTSDVWENSHADAAVDATPLNVDNRSEFPPNEDRDKEEYTGSLADTKVFTPSTQTAPGGGSAPLTDATNVVGSGGPPSSNHLTNSTSGAGNTEILNKMDLGASQADGVTGGSVQGGVTKSKSFGCAVVVLGQSIDVNMLLQKPQTNSSTSTGARSNPEANLLALLHQSSYTSSNQLGLSNQALPQRQKVQRPRGPQTSKIPASAVEMPDNAVTTLNVQFGSLDFGTDSSVTFNSVMHENIASGDSLLYGSASSEMGTFLATSGTDKDGVQLKTGSSVTDSSPFQIQRTFQVDQPASLNETNKASIPSNSSPSLDRQAFVPAGKQLDKPEDPHPTTFIHLPLEWLNHSFSHYMRVFQGEIQKQRDVERRNEERLRLQRLKLLVHRWMDKNGIRIRTTPIEEYPPYHPSRSRFPPPKSYTPIRGRSPIRPLQPPPLLPLTPIILTVRSSASPTTQPSHRSGHHLPRPYLCQMCDRHFTSEEKLASHLEKCEQQKAKKALNAIKNLAKWKARKGL